MNTEEVVAMLDAITEGQPFTLESTGDERVKLEFGPHSFGFQLRDDLALVEIDNPRTAREIAGALIAWANRKEGQKAALSTREDRQQMHSVDAQHAIEGSLGLYEGDKTRNEHVSRAIEAMGYDPVATQQVAAFDANMRVIDEGGVRRQIRVFGQMNDGKKRVGNSTYADWYRRSVHLMSQETKDRNLKDLRAIQASNPAGEEWDDIEAAIQVLLANGAKSTYDNVLVDEVHVLKDKPHGPTNDCLGCD